MYERINNWRRWKMPHESVSKYIESVSKIWKKRQERSINAVVVSISVLFSSVAQSCLTLCDPMDYSTSLTARLPYPSPTPRACSNSCPLFGDAIQPSHPPSSTSPPAFNLSQHQGLFQWVSFSRQEPKVLELQHEFLPLNIDGWFPLGLTGLISLPSKRLSRVFSNTIVQKHQFFGAQLSL